MRLLCFASGGCRWNVIKEDWIPPTKDRSYPLLVRYHECAYCKDTKATLTSPKVAESHFCIPDKFCVEDANAANA